MSNEDLHQAVQKILDEHPATARLRVKVEVEDCIVVLRGRVSTYYAKQLAQEVIRPVLKSFGYPTLRNLIEVLRG